jgi:hypothetical protein
VTTLIESALDYAGLGMSVIPLHTPDGRGCSCRRDDCTSVGKHPRLMHGLSEASLDPAVVRRWWDMWPDANIGLVIPHGYVAVDIDGQDGVDSLKAAGYDFPQTATARTGRGFHYLYRTSLDIPPRVGFLNHVDLRGPGSYIVAAPSRHANGTEYAWVRPPTAVAQAPEWLVARSAQTDAAWRERFDTASALEGVGEGNRDIALFKLAAKLRYADVPHEVALGLVLEAAARCVPPFPERDARLKVDSAYGRYQPTVVADRGGYEVTVVARDAVVVRADSPKGPVEIAFSEMELGSHALETDVRVTLLMPGIGAEPYVQRLNVLSASSREGMRRELDAIFGKEPGWTSLLARAVTKAHDAFITVDRSKRWADLVVPDALGFVVDVMVPDEGVTILFGSGSAGKTMVALHMAICVALGLPWLGRDTQRRNVLWIDHESGEQVLALRSARICAALGIDQSEVADRLHYWGAEGSPLADSIPGLRRVIQAKNIGLVILDHVAAACGSEPEKSDSALRFYRAQAKLGAPMLALAHITGEMERDPSQVLRPFGSIFWHNGARRTWFIQKYQEQESSVAALGLFNRKVNDGMKPADFGLNLFYNDPYGPIQVVAADMQLTPELQAVQGREFVLAGLVTRPMTYAQMAEASGWPVNTVKSIVRRNPRVFCQVDGPETDAQGGRGNVVHWVVRPDWGGHGNRCNKPMHPIEKIRESVSVGEGYAPLPQTDSDKPTQTGATDAVHRFTGPGRNGDAVPAPRCPDCAAPLFGDTCVACAGWN